VTVVIDVAPTIPDNEALTALATLRTLGVDLGALERADLWRFDVDPAAADGLVDAVRGIETIFNPNKHALNVRDSLEPRAGEVWIDEPAAAVRFGTPPLRIAGRVLAGIDRVERFTAWRLRDRHGAPAAREVVDRALETLLLNPAFQRAIR
jgi:hypothetical protein